jgi:hypothetical protein
MPNSTSGLYRLSVRFPAEVASFGRTSSLKIPLGNSELRISTSNDKPVSRIARYCSADFTPEFLKRGHQFLYHEATVDLHLQSIDLHLQTIRSAPFQTVLCG